MNIDKLKDVSLYMIIGSPGTGKTVITHELKKSLKKDIETLDDFAFNVSKLSYRDRTNPIHYLMNRVSKMRHEDKPIIVVSHYSQIFKRIILSLRSSVVEKDIRPKYAIILTDMTVEEYYNVGLHIPKELAIKFRNASKRSSQGKNKTRPYLVITQHDGQRMGWYNDSRKPITEYSKRDSQ